MAEAELAQERGATEEDREAGKGHVSMSWDLVCHTKPLEVLKRERDDFLILFIALAVV